MEKVILPLGVCGSSPSWAEMVAIGCRQSWNSVTETHPLNAVNTGTSSFSSVTNILRKKNKNKQKKTVISTLISLNEVIKCSRDLLEGIAAVSGGVAELVVVPGLDDERVRLLLLPVQVIRHHDGSRFTIDRKSPLKSSIKHQLSIRMTI